MDIQQRSAQRVLLVEDNAALRSVYQKLLEASHFRVVTAENGRQALDWLAEYPVEVVVSDIGMPVMDGLELATAIRANPNHAGLFLIAVTAFAQDSVVQQVRAAGYNALLMKPIHYLDLCDCIRGQPVQTDRLNPPGVRSHPGRHSHPLEDSHGRIASPTRHRHSDSARRVGERARPDESSVQP